MIVSCATLAKCSLQKAARAGSLVMVVRKETWKPDVRDKIKYAILHLPRQFKKSGKDTDRAYKLWDV
jgi:hypothetical protein